MVRTNFYRAKKLKSGKHLITLDSGDWVALGEQKFREFSKGKVKTGSMLYNILKDKNVILDKDNEYVKRLKSRYKHLYHGASLHIVAVTARCNNVCVYCHANAKISDNKQLDMDKRIAKRTVDFIFQSPNDTLSIEFQGGEPLLNFDVVKYVIEYARKKNQIMQKSLQISLVTNLALMDDNKLKLLMNNRVGLCTSLDGPAIVHDKNRKDEKGGTHADVVKWISAIKKKYPLEALMVTTKHSLKYPKEIIDEYLKYGFKNIQIRPLSKLGFALKNEEIGYTWKDYIKFWKTSMDYILDINRKQIFRERFSTYILQKFFMNPGAEFVDLNSPCGAAISTLAYDHNGDIFSCDEGRQYDLFKLGTVDMKYQELFETQGCQSLIKSSANDCLLCDACVWKPFCGICVVCNYAETGNLIPILSQNDRCKIMMAKFEYLMDKILEDKHNETFIKWIEA